MEIRKSIRDFIRSEMNVGLDTANLKDDDSLLDAGLIDSLGIQRLLVFLEETFEIKMIDEELTPENFESIERIASFLEAKVSHRPGE